MSLWRADPACPAAIRNKLERVVQALPAEYLASPRNGEEFTSAEACLRRLQGYALSEGFAVVKAAGSLRSKRPRIQYKCIHHGKDTRNTRHLEDHRQQDSEDTIITRRKREATLTYQKECPWAVYLSQRKAPDGKRLSLFLGITQANHSHPMAANPLRYPQHEKALDEHVEAARIATFHRESHLSHAVSQRILEKEGLTLPRNDYYNLHREKAIGNAVGDNFEALIHALDEAGFIYACRIEEIRNEANNGIERQLQQVWFTLEEQIQLARRFIADFAVLIDGTFSTNKLNLTLITMVGLTNTGRSFPAVQSFARSEATMSFDFILECNKDFIFSDSISPPRVVISDQAVGKF